MNQFTTAVENDVLLEMRSRRTRPRSRSPKKKAEKMRNNTIRSGEVNGLFDVAAAYASVSQTNRIGDRLFVRSNVDR